MAQIIPVIVLAVVAAFSYEMPILLARLVGQEAALNGLWAAVWQDSLAAKVVFVTAYMLTGAALWIAPLVYVVALLHPGYSRRVRDRTRRVVVFVAGPLRPLLEGWQRRREQSRDAIERRRALLTLYTAEFKDNFVSFGEFEHYYDRLSDGNQVDHGQPVRLAITACLDELKDAEILLGLQKGYGRDELTARYRALAMQVHPDKAGPNDIFRRVTDARDIINLRRGWK
jgi:hypothetical protein